MQGFLEGLDKKERANNLMIIGMEESTNDEENAKQLLSSLTTDDSPEVKIVSSKRVGTQEPGKVRALLVRLESGRTRDALADAARRSTDLGDIRVKKDSHPAIRAEWKRLFEVKRKEEAANAGKAVALDFRKRQVTVDGVTVDSWRPVF
jgi:hypothetical protein